MSTRPAAHAATRAFRQVRHDPSDRPFIVIWETTRACPLKCVHCRAEAQPFRVPGELTTQEAARLMEEVASFGSPPPLFVITGGDPFQRPDLFELVRHGTEAGLPVAVSPSGTPTLTPENLARLQEAGARALSLSLDGSTAEIHDGFRQVDGVYDWTIRAWDTARELGLKVQINTTVAQHNLDDLPDIARIVADHGAMTWSAFFLVPTGRAVQMGLLTPDQVEDVLNALYDVGGVIPVKTTEAHHFRRVIVQRMILEHYGDDHEAVLGLGPLYRRLRDRLAGLGLTGDTGPKRVRRPPLDINAGRGFVFISHVGTVHPSGFLPMDAGDVHETPLPEIYRTSPLFTSLRDPDQFKGRCGACEFASVCGGSRSRAYAVTGDPLAEEPWCSYVPRSFPYQEDVARVLAGRPLPDPATRGRAIS